MLMNGYKIYIYFLPVPAELAILSGEEGDVTALAPVDAFKVEVAAGLHRPAAHQRPLSRTGTTYRYLAYTRPDTGTFYFSTQSTGLLQSGQDQVCGSGSWS